MPSLTWLTLLAVPLSLTACDNANDTEMPMEDEGMPMGPDATPMDGENMPTIQSGAARTASAEGTVTAIDAEALDWPAMTMAFDAAPEVRSQVAVGDAVTFEFEASDAGNRIASVSKK